MTKKNPLHYAMTIVALLVFSTAASAGERSTLAEKEQATAISNYRIGPGDVIEVSVWKDDSLSRVTVVLPDGNIAIPLMGEFRAEGDTVAELQEKIAARLKRYMPDPIVTVIVQQVNSLNIYVIGKVNRPGVMKLTSQVNVLQALAMAGGLGTFAKSGKIKIFRNVGDETRLMHFDFDDVAKGKNMAQNIMLQRGDVIVVP